MDTEYLYLGRDNRNDFRLKIDGVVADLSAVTKMELIFSDTLTVSSESADGVFDWSIGNGELRLSLGGLTGLASGTRVSADLIVYDNANTNGVRWGAIKFKVK